MGKGDAKALRASYMGALREVLGRFDEPSLLELRGELQVAERWLERRAEADRARSARVALDAVTRLYQFTAEVRGFAESRKAAETASMFDLGAVGVLALENILTADKVTLMRLLMSGLSEGLMFLASRQYVGGSNAVLTATYRSHAVAVRDGLWALAADFRSGDDIAAMREARAAIETLFAKLDDPGVAVGAKVTVIYQLYALVALVRCARFLQDLEGLR